MGTNTRRNPIYTPSTFLPSPPSIRFLSFSASFIHPTLSCRLTKSEHKAFRCYSAFSQPWAKKTFSDPHTDLRVDHAHDYRWWDMKGVAAFRREVHTRQLVPVQIRGWATVFWPPPADVFNFLIRLATWFSTSDSVACRNPNLSEWQMHCALTLCTPKQSSHLPLCSPPY
jgi:hypothetical protein